jgi:hypothetical protein
MVMPAIVQENQPSNLDTFLDAGEGFGHEEPEDQLEQQRDIPHQFDIGDCGIAEQPVV